MKKRLVIGLFVAAMLGGSAAYLYADDSLFCAVCYGWGKGSDLWNFFGCSPQCDNNSPVGG